MNTRTVALLAIAVVFGIIVGGAGVVALEETRQTKHEPQLGEDPAYYFSSGTTRTADSHENPAAGWLHEVQTDDEIIVTGNASVRHPANTSVDVEIRAAGRDDYVIQLTTEPTNGTKAATPQVSDVQWGTSIPSDYGSIELRAGTERIRIIENDEATTPRLFSLPNPITLQE